MRLNLGGDLGMNKRLFASRVVVFFFFLIQSQPGLEKICPRCGLICAHKTVNTIPFKARSSSSSDIDSFFYRIS